MPLNNCLPGSTFAAAWAAATVSSSDAISMKSLPSLSDGPEVNVQAADVLRHLGRPTRPEVVAVRDDGRAGPQVVFECWQQLVQHPRQQKEDDDGCRPHVGFEQVTVNESYAVRNVCFLRVVVRLVDQPSLDLDADTARAVTLRGRDRNAPVA